jgi:protein-S-isoprenylcysteine O-methyltransferase Ste14
MASALFKRLVQVAGFLLAWGIVLFLCAGRLDWMRGWICIALYLAALAGTATAALRLNPAIIAARGRWHRDTKRFDKVYVALSAPLAFLLPAVAGLDAGRFGRTSLPQWTLYGGALLFLFGGVIVGWTMAVNPYLETTVRIQSDRGHKVITSGPYRFVRHPMYAGGLLQLAAVPLVLGSAWAFAVAGASAALLLWRTLLEDRTLVRELPGYREYASGTRYRLLPRIW